MVRLEDREVPPTAVRDIDMPPPSTRGGRTGGMQRLGVRAQTCDLIFGRWLAMAISERAGQGGVEALVGTVGDGCGREYWVLKECLVSPSRADDRSPTSRGGRATPRSRRLRRVEERQSP